MYILFEEHQYESRLVEKVLKDIYVLQDVNKKVSVQYVGYFYNPHLHDCVFILPKVLLTEQETLVGMELPTGEQVNPEQVLTPEGQIARPFCTNICHRLAGAGGIGPILTLILCCRLSHLTKRTGILYCSPSRICIGGTTKSTGLEPSATHRHLCRATTWFI